jgi:ABC-type lipoprotein export system ATPase subunit
MKGDNEYIILTEALTKKYRMGEVDVIALRDASLAVARGEFLAITGPSGSGKSTFLNLIGTLDEPTTGRVVVDGVDVSTLKGNQLADFRRKTIGFVFQLFNLIPVLTALENVKLPLIPYRKLCKFNLDERARELLAAVGLEGREHHLPSQLSGGEQQRVAIARALINEPKIILADEPTGNVDSVAGSRIISLLRRMREERGVTIVLATHNEEIAKEADRIVRLRDGMIV